jgi:hypothetical protein
MIRNTWFHNLAVSSTHLSRKFLYEIQAAKYGGDIYANTAEFALQLNRMFTVGKFK